MSTGDCDTINCYYDGRKTHFVNLFGYPVVIYDNDVLTFKIQSKSQKRMLPTESAPPERMSVVYIVSAEVGMRYSHRKDFLIPKTCHIKDDGSIRFYSGLVRPADLFASEEEEKSNSEDDYYN